METSYWVEQLKRTVAFERVAVVVGSGISTSSANLPGWRQAALLAIDHLNSIGTCPPDEIAALRRDLENSETVEELLAVAASLRQRLTGSSSGSGEFATWLATTFGVGPEAIVDASPLRAIHRLPATLLTTTNYDRLLAAYKAGMQAVTWQEPSRLANALHGYGLVVHLHGVWDVPSSVIFGTEDYEQVIDAEGYEYFLKTLWMDRTMLFIGCSLDGLRDPDFSRLMDHMATTFPDSTVRHYALVRSGTFTPEDSEQFLNRWRLQLIPYGASYADLVPFLEALLPASAPGTPLPPRIFEGRAHQIEILAAAISAKQSVLVHGMGGIGKSSLVSKALAKCRDESLIATPVWLDEAGSRLADICRNICAVLGVTECSYLADDALFVRVANELGAVDSPVVVIDNVSDLGLIQGFRDTILRSDVPLVAISRLRGAGFDCSVEVPSLNAAEAEALFRKVAGISNDGELVHRICSSLEGHPLAIVLAAGRHVAEALPLKRLLERLVDEKLRLATLHDPDRGDSPTTSVRASLTISLESLPADVLHALAHLAVLAADTPIPFLASVLKAKTIDCEDWVGMLVSRSLVSLTSEGAVHLHPLVRDAVRERAGEQASTIELEIERAFASLIQSLSNPPNESARLFVENREVVFAFIRNTNTQSSEARKAVAVVLVIALFEPHGVIRRYALERGVIGGAQETLESAIGWVKAQGDGQLHIALLTCKSAVYMEMGRPNLAFETLVEAQRIAIASGSDLATHASIKREIGNLLCETNQLLAAESMMRAGLADAVNSGQESVVAPLHGQLGLVLKRMHRYEESREEYIKARSIYQKNGDLVGVAACDHNLAEIAEATGDLEGAWQLECDSLRAELQADNVSGAIGSLEKLASRVKSACRLDYVVSQVDSLFASCPYITLAEHRGLSESLKATSNLNAGNMNEAESLFLESVTLRREIEDFKGIGVCFGNLSIMKFRQGEFENAWDYNQQSLSAYQRAGHVVGIRTCLFNGIEIALELGKVEAALDYACDAIHLSAQIGDLVTVVSAVYSLASRVLPSLAMNPTVLYPKATLPYEVLMDVLADAAGERNIGVLLGAFTQLASRFGPGGVEHPKDFYGGFRDIESD